MFLFNFICLFYLMVLTNCLTISKSNQRTAYNDEKYEGTNLDDPSYSHQLMYEKRDLFHHKRTEKPHRDFESLVLHKQSTKAIKHRGIWGKFRKLFHRKARKDKKKATTTCRPNCRRENTLAAEIMYHKFKEDEKTTDNINTRHHSRFDDAGLNVYFGRQRLRLRRNPKRSTRADLLNNPDSYHDQHKEYPVVSYVMRTITVQAPLDPNFLYTPTERRLGTRSFNPLRKFKSQLKKLNQPVVKIVTTSTEGTTTDAFDRVMLMHPYKFKITNTSPRFCTTSQMEGYLKDLNNRNVHLVSSKLPSFSEIISYSVTEAMFSTEPFFGSTPTSLANSFTHMNKGLKESDKNEQHASATRSDRQAFLGEKIYTAATEYESKIQGKMNKMYEKLKKKFNYKPDRDTNAINFKSSPKVTEPPTKKSIVMEIYKRKRKRYDKKSTGQPRRSRTKLHKVQVKAVQTQTLADESKEKSALNESEELTAEKKIDNDFVMLDVYEQMLGKMHRTNINYMLATAPNWTPEGKKKHMKKRHIFATNTEKEYKNLAKKIAYDDYVNGYKHYLSFQKRLNKDNFSDAIKFQAHMHHNVNDIGKFILSKIPPTPVTVGKRDLEDLEDLEVTPKTDDKWFKKYLSFLVETSAPKKYHSTQTVSLKPSPETSALFTPATKSAIETTTPYEIYWTEATAQDDEDFTHTYSKSPQGEEPVTLEEESSNVQISVSDKMVYLNNIRSRFLEKLRENLNLDLLTKYVNSKDITDTEIQTEELADKVKRFKRHKKEVNMHKALNDSDETSNPLAAKMRNVCYKGRNKEKRILTKEKRAQPMRHSRQSRDRGDRIPRFDVLKKIKHIFVIDDNTTDSYHGSENMGSHKATEKHNLNLAEILKSLHNISEILEPLNCLEKPFVIKDENNDDNWYDVGSKEGDKNTKYGLNNGYPGVISSTGGIFDEEAFPEELTQLIVSKEFSKSQNEKHAERDQLGRRADYRGQEKKACNTATDNLFARKNTWKTAVPSTSVSLSPNKLEKQDNSDLNTNEPPSEEEDTSDADDNNINLQKQNDEGTGLNFSKTDEIEANDTKQKFKQVIDLDSIDTKLPKDLGSDLDNKYSVGSFRTQLTTVTKFYDKQPVTNNIDAVVKYVAVSNDKSENGSKTMDKENIIKNALKTMLEKMSNENGNSMKKPNLYQDDGNKYKFNTGDHYGIFYDKEDEEKEPLVVAPDELLNYDKTGRIEESPDDKFDDSNNDSFDARTTSHYFTEPETTESSTLETSYAKPKYLKLSARNKKNYPTESYYGRYDPYVPDEATAKILQEVERSREIPVYKKLDHGLNPTRKPVQYDDLVQHVYGVTTEPTHYFNDLMNWNDEVLNKETDYNNKFMNNPKASDQVLDTLQKEANDIKNYLKKWTGTMPSPPEVYPLQDTQHESITIKPFLPNYHRLVNIARGLGDGGDQFYLAEAGDFTRQRGKKSRSSANELATEKKKTTRPSHYFTTPMPMTTEQFDKFLRDNSLDVGSVTSPLYKGHKPQNVQVEEIEHFQQTKKEDFEKAQINNMLKKAHHRMKSPLGKGRHSIDVGMKEDGLEKVHYNLQLEKIHHNKVNQPEKGHHNIKAQLGKGHELGKTQHSKIDNLDLKENYLQKELDTKEELIKEEHDLDSIEHATDETDKFKLVNKEERGKIESKIHATDETDKYKTVKKEERGKIQSNKDKINDLDTIQHSIEQGFGSKLDNILNAKNIKEPTTEKEFHSKLEKILNAEKNQLQKEPVVKILGKQEKKVNTHSKVKGSVINNNSFTKDKKNFSLLDRSIIKDYLAKFTNDGKEIRTHKHTAKENEYYVKDHTKKNAKKKGRQTTKLDCMIKQGKTTATFMEINDEENYDDENDQGEYEISDWKILFGDKDTFKDNTNLNKLTHNEKPLSKTNDAENIDVFFEGTTAVKKPGNNMRLFSAIARTKSFQYFMQPTTDYSFTKFIKSNNQTPQYKLKRPQTTKDQNNEINNTFLPLMRHQFKGSFANDIPDHKIVKPLYKQYKDKSMTNLESEDTNDVVKFDANNITTENTNEIIDNIVEAIETLNKQKYGHFPSQATANNDPWFTSGYPAKKKEKTATRTQGIFNPERRPAVFPARKINPFVNTTTINNKTSTPAIKRIQISGESYKYAIIFGGNENVTKERTANKLSDSHNEMAVQSKPHGRQLKENTPEHSWHLSHLWAKTNSTRKKSSKIKTIPGVKWRSSADTTNYKNYNHPQEDKLNNGDVERVSYDYDQRDLQESNNHEGRNWKEEKQERKSKRSLEKNRDVTVTLDTNDGTQRRLKHDAQKLNEPNSEISRRQSETQTYTIKNVGSIEVLIELQNNAQTKRDPTPNRVPESKENHLDLMRTLIPQAIQVKIPNYSTQKAESNYNIERVAVTPKSCEVKKVFRAKFSSPVNLEYQIKTKDDTAIPTVTKINAFAKKSTEIKSNLVGAEKGLSPGVHVSVHGDQNTMPTEKQYVLKPLISVKNSAVNRIGQVALNTAIVTTTDQTTKNIGRVTISRDLIVDIKELLSKLISEDYNAHIMSSNNRRQIHESIIKKVMVKRRTEPLEEKSKIHLNETCLEKQNKYNLWDAIKRMLGIKSVCHCKCKLNKPMCGMCGATDAVVTELIFELNNIVNFMNDNCGEIQNYFMLNPRGGKKLRDTVNLLDRQLTNYYNRLKGKCKNDSCCSHFVTYWDKRSAVKETLENIPNNKERNNKRSVPKENNAYLQDLNSILSDIKEKLNNLSCKVEQTTTPSNKLSLIEEKRFDTNEEILVNKGQSSKVNNASVESMSDILSDVKKKLDHVFEINEDTTTSKEPFFKENKLNEIYRKKQGKKEHVKKSKEYPSKEQYVYLLTKHLNKLYNDLQDMIELNMTLDNKILRKADLLKCIVENLTLGSKLAKIQSNFHVNNVKIKMIGDNEDKKPIDITQPKIYDTYETNKVNTNTAWKKTRPDKSKNINEVTRLKYKTTYHPTLNTPDINAKYNDIEYSDTDELKSKGLKEQIRNIFANSNVKDVKAKNLPAEYCVYKNKAYKIIRPNKRHIKNCDRLTDNPTTSNVSEDSWEDFVKRTTYDNNRGIIIDAALKEIITTDCVSRAQEKFDTRPTENKITRKDSISFSAKTVRVKSEKSNSCNEALTKINESLEKHKSIEKIIDFMVILEKVLAMNNLTESFYDLLTNKNPQLSEEKNSNNAPSTSALLKKLTNSNKNPIEENTDSMKQPIYTKLYADSINDNFSSLNPDFFTLMSSSKFETTAAMPKEFKSTEKTPNVHDMNPLYYTTYLMSSMSETTEKRHTSAVYNTNIRNFFNTIAVEPKNYETQCKLLKTLKDSTKIPYQFVDSLKKSTVKNEDLKDILSSYGLKEVTLTAKLQATTPKISNFRDILLTILMYEAINLSKEFQKFTIPDELSSSRIIVAIEPGFTEKTNKIATSTIIEITQTKPIIKIPTTALMQNTDTITTKVMADIETPTKKVTEKGDVITESVGKTLALIIKPNERTKSLTMFNSEKVESLNKPITTSEGTTTIENSNNETRKFNEQSEGLPEVTTKVYPWNIHVYGKKFFIPPFRGSSAADNEDNLKKFLNTFTKPPDKKISHNMLEKLVQKIMPTKLPWKDSKLELTTKNKQLPPIAKWAKKYFNFGKKSRKYPINTSNDYGTSTMTMKAAHMSIKSSTEVNIDNNYAKYDNSEKCDRDPSQCLCDLESTFRHILDCHRTMPAEDFERFVQNISCKRFKEIPRNLVIDLKKAVSKRSEITARGSVKWDWIRDKRSVDSSQGLVRTVRKRSLLSIDTEFERLFKGSDGIYRRSSRKKRSKRESDLTELNASMIKLPTIEDTASNMYAIVGDTVEIECDPSKGKPRLDLDPREYSWQVERGAMMLYSNVVDDGDRIVLKNVQPRNVGTYNCSWGDALFRSVKLNVLALPNFTILFLPAYETGIECHYRDLRAIKRGLPTALAELGCAGGKLCSVRVEDPICMKDKDNDRTAVRASAVFAPAVHSIPCSVQCRRDLQCALAMLCARNIPLLASIPVLLKDGASERRFPVAVLSRRRWIVTHSLRRRAPGSTPDYRNQLSTMASGDVEVLILCPAGHQLVVDKKVCEVCPIDTFAGAGSNECRPCPTDLGASDPGSGECRPASLLGRFYWWCPCLLVWMAPTMMLCVCVILCCCQRRCLGMSTPDCRETKLDIWKNEKERKLPPPLPAVDFDY